MRWFFPVALVSLMLFALALSLLLLLGMSGADEGVNRWLGEKFGLSHLLRVDSGWVLFLVSLPFIILLLAFLKLKRKPQVVSSTYLWKKSIEDLHVNRLLQWLRRNLLLLLQIAAAIGLALAVFGPRLHGSSVAGRFYVLMIDHSASMSATDIAPNRLAYAKQQALREIEAANETDSGMVIAFAGAAEIRQSFTTNKMQLRAAVEAIEATRETTRLEEALALAESLANPSRSTENEAVRPQDAEPGKERTYAAFEGTETEVHVFSDGRFADVPNFALTNLRMRLHPPAVPADAVERSTNNLAITRLDALRGETDANQVKLFIEIRNFRLQPADASVLIDIVSAGRQRDERIRRLVIPARQIIPPTEKEPEKEVPGQQTITLDLENNPDNVETRITARLADAKDSLPLDDTAYLVLGVRRRTQVLLVGPGNVALDFFFDSSSVGKIAQVQRLKPAELNDPAKYLNPAREARFDLVIFDRCGPARLEDMPQANTYFIGFPPPPWKLPAGTKEQPDDYTVREVKFPQVRGWNDTHPVMRGIRGWQDLELAETLRFGTLPGKVPVLLEGENSLPLLFLLNRGPYTDMVQAFPLETLDGNWNTRWFLQPSFPLFLRNVLYSLGKVRDAASEPARRPGEIIKLRRETATSTIEVVPPGGTGIDLSRQAGEEIRFHETRELGFYRVKMGDREETFAVNLFDVQESNIAPREEFQVGAETVKTSSPRPAPRELWKWILCITLVLVLWEWWAYLSRIRI